MQFVKGIKFTKGKTEETIESTDMIVAEGVVHRINIVFPPGCAGLVNIALFIGGHQFAPSTENQYYTGGGETVEFNEFQEMKEEPFIITVKGFNEDEAYDHTIEIRIFILDKKVLLPAGSTEGILAGLKDLVVNKFVFTPAVEEENDSG